MGGRRRQRVELVALDRIEQFGAGDEHHASAQHGQHGARPAGNRLKVMAAAFGGADGNGVDHQEGFEPRLDGEQTRDLQTHGHRLSKRRANGAVPPFRT
jgi:hypothetical protein